MAAGSAIVIAAPAAAAAGVGYGAYRLLRRVRRSGGLAPSTSTSDRSFVSADGGTLAEVVDVEEESSE